MGGTTENGTGDFSDIAIEAAERVGQVIREAWEHGYNAGHAAGAEQLREQLQRMSMQEVIALCAGITTEPRTVEVEVRKTMERVGIKRARDIRLMWKVEPNAELIAQEVNLQGRDPVRMVREVVCGIHYRPSSHEQWHECDLSVLTLLVGKASDDYRAWLTQHITELPPTMRQAALAVSIRKAPEGARP